MNFASRVFYQSWLILILNYNIIILVELYCFCFFHFFIQHVPCSGDFKFGVSFSYLLVGFKSLKLELCERLR